MSIIWKAFKENWNPAPLPFTMATKNQCL